MSCLKFMEIDSTVLALQKQYSEELERIESVIQEEYASSTFKPSPADIRRRYLELKHARLDDIEARLLAAKQLSTKVAVFV